MKYNIVLTSLFFAIIYTLLISVKGKVPDFIDRCRENDPQLAKCIRNNILNMRDRLAKGIPELDVPALDPLHMEEWTWDVGVGMKAVNRNMVLTGGKNFEIVDLVVDPDANTYSFVIKIPEIIANGDYEIDATVASIPLKGKGKVHLTGRSIIANGTLHGKKVIREGKTYYWFPSMDMKLAIGDYDVKLDNLFDQDPSVGESINKLLNDEKTEVLATVLPIVEKTFIKHMLLTANNISKKFTWDELFLTS